MQPMKGIRIIEVTSNASGPLTTGLLADQGADVIRLESVGAGDPARYAGGVRGGVTGYNAYLNRNKRSMAVNLKDEKLRPMLYELIKTADVFVQNSRPGALARSGYGFEDLHKINPDLIYASISGFGPTGPAAGVRVYDPIVQGASGLASVQGIGGEPELVKTIVSDKVTAYTTAQAISAALFARERGEVKGHHVEVSMLDASLAFLWADLYWNHSFVGDEGFDAKPLLAEFYKVLKTADGYLTMIIVADVEFQGACRVLNVEHLLGDKRFNSIAERFANYSLMFQEMQVEALKASSNTLVERLEAEGVPCGKINSLDDVFNDERVKHADSIIEYDHPQGGRMRQVRPPAKFDGEPGEIRRPSPGLGEHTDELLKSIGCSEETLQQLRQSGAIG